ncbi:MAG: hypothetical protein ACSHX0_13410 [Akkermansiaceae bacterium]
MEKLKISETAINYGKGLIERLDPDISQDPLVRWVCMHLARLIEKSEEQADDVMAPIHRECMEVIQGFWASRANLPYTLRPFQEWEVLFETVTQLGNNGVGHFSGLSALKEKYEASKAAEEAKLSLDVALLLDTLTPKLILFCLRDAAKSSDSDFVRKALAIAEEEGGGYDVKAIKFMLGVANEAERNEQDEQAEQYQEILEQISHFEKLLPLLKKSIEEEMESRSTD